MDRVNRARQELANTRGKLAEVKISIQDAEIILEAAIAEGERLQKEMDDNKAAQAKNLELRKFTANLHEVAVEEEKTANEIETRALCLERDLKYVAKFSRLTDRRYFLLKIMCNPTELFFGSFQIQAGFGRHRCTHELHQ